MKCGSTSVSCLIVGKLLTVACLGDTEAILGVKEKDKTYSVSFTFFIFIFILFQSLLLTKRHVATDPEENTRIKSVGGAVCFGRVYGTLAISRAFGDYEFKV